MMREYKRYDEYKDSGVEWLGEVPTNWKISKIKYEYNFFTGFTPSSGNDSYYNINGYDWLNISDIKNKYVFKAKSKISDKAIREYAPKISPKNSLVFSFKLSIGKIAILKKDIYTNEALATFIQNKSNDIKYLYYTAPIFIPKNAKENIYGAKILNQRLINDALLLKPSKNEQQKIVSFLDQKTAEIDEIINKKEKLIDHLEKYKKSVITEAVSKGKLGNNYINSDGELVDEIEMKDSGVEWIDQIPEYCEPIRLKYVLDKIEYGLSESSSGDGEYKILTMGNISDGKIIVPEQGSLDNIDKNYLLKNKDLLFNRTNSMEQIAKVGIFLGNKKDKVTFASYLVRLVPNENNNNEFINYMLNNYKFLDYAKSYAIPSINQANLNPTRYTNLFIIRFPLEVQQSLVEKINLKTEQIEKIIQKTEQSIEKYKEYKKSLIFEAVTGKIDLRDYQLKGGE